MTFGFPLAYNLTTPYLGREPKARVATTMVCDSVMLTLVMLTWLCATGYKDDVDNAKELFKSILVNKAMCLFWPAKLNATPNTLLDDDDDDDVDVQVCDDDDMFDMVNVGSLAKTSRAERAPFLTR
jgi:hypothetical protein